jgi:hypothetical protein
MDRRQALRLLAATISASVFSRDLFLFGQELHAQLASSPALRTLNAHQNATVIAMTELIIPTTDTPGAKAARVNEFIDVILTDWCTAEDCALFLNGLAEADKRSRARFGWDFINCDQRQQIDILTAFDHEVARLREGVLRTLSARSETTPIKHFFFLMKRFTLIGYYTSEIGAQQELHYEVIPTRYHGCVPLEHAMKTSSDSSRLITISPAAVRKN